MQVELALAERWSLYAGPHLRLFDAIGSTEHEPYRGYGVELGVRRYLTARPPKAPGC